MPEAAQIRNFYNNAGDPQRGSVPANPEKASKCVLPEFAGQFGERADRDADQRPFRRAMRISARGPAWSENSDLTVFRTGPASHS
jgi:hypothetical protein